MDENVIVGFTRVELEEIRKWAEVIGYQGNARELEKALAMNRGIVGKIVEVLTGDAKRGNSDGTSMKESDDETENTG